MRVQIISILYQFLQAASALFTVGGVHVRGMKAEMLPRFEFAREYGESAPIDSSWEVHSKQGHNISIIHQVVDHPTSNQVCPDYRGMSGGERDLKIDASPGSIIELQYLKDQLPKSDHTGRGFITWYGVRNFLNPSTTTFGDIIDFQEGRKGDVLAGSNSYNASFRIPSQLAYGDTYTLYWVWNTTYSLNGGFLSFTSCININIVENSTTVAPIVKETPDFSSGTALGPTSSIASKKPGMSEWRRQLNPRSSHRPITLWASESPNCQGQWAYTPFDFKSFIGNNSNFYVSRSFRLSRPLESQEQLDLSHATNYSAWYNTKSQSLQSPNPACDIFDQSYFAWNSSTDCYNTPAFTCHRLWINPGLPL